MIGSLAAALAELENEVAEGSPAPPIRRHRLKLSDIEVVEEVFQPRRGIAGKDRWASEDHRKGLREGLRDTPGHRLEPIRVWWSGRRWCVVDGHHRLEAYRGFYRDRPEMTPWVPAKAFEGNLREAEGASIRGNSRNKLPMSKEDKMDAAWRLTCRGGWTRREISEITGASRSQLTIMNRARDTLTGMAEADLADLSWNRARAESRGRDVTPWDDDRTEKEAKKMTEKLRKHLGPNLYRKAHILAMALEEYHDDLPKRVLQHMDQDTVVAEARNILADPDYFDDAASDHVDDAAPAYVDDGNDAPF